MTNVCKYLYHLVLLGSILSLCACSFHQSVKSNQPVQEESVRTDFVAQGDKWAGKRHYLGWREASRYYFRAAETDDSDSLRMKRFWTQGLLLMRKIELYVSVQLDEFQEFDSLIPGQLRPIEKCLVWLLAMHKSELSKRTPQEEYAEQSRLRAEPVIEIDSLQDDREIYVAYKYLSKRGSYNEDLRELRIQQHALAEMMSERYPQSPLQLFLELDKIGSFAQFFELGDDYLEPRLFEAQQLLFLGKKHSAEQLFLHVLEKTNEIPGVFSGLGKIQLLYENYDAAAEFYLKAVNILPNDYESLLGLGVAQMYMGAYEKSLATFSSLVERKLAYQGEARYYQALNLYHCKRLPEALTALDEAKFYVPDLPDIYELEGIIHYHRDSLTKSRKSFLEAKHKSAQQKNQRSIPDFYLGLIAFKQGHIKEMFAYFEAFTLIDLAELEHKSAQLKLAEEDDELSRDYQVFQKTLRRYLSDCRKRFEVISPLLKYCSVPRQKLLLEERVATLNRVIVK